jgi:Na+/H+-dicarboxylate symporter
VAALFAADQLMDTAPSSVNVVGDCLAAVVMARREGEFSNERSKVFGTPSERFAKVANFEVLV